MPGVTPRGVTEIEIRVAMKSLGGDAHTRKVIFADATPRSVDSGGPI